MVGPPWPRKPPSLDGAPSHWPYLPWEGASLPLQRMEVLTHSLADN